MFFASSVEHPGDNSAFVAAFLPQTICSYFTLPSPIFNGTSKTDISPLPAIQVRALPARLSLPRAASTTSSIAESHPLPVVSTSARHTPSALTVSCWASKVPSSQRCYRPERICDVAEVLPQYPRGGDAPMKASTTIHSAKNTRNTEERRVA